MKIRIGNYRNIPFDNPLEFEIKEGITFVLGPNNVGKSNLINFFFDFRPIFSAENLDQQHTPNFNLKISGDKFFDQLVNRRSTKEVIFLEISNDENHTVCYSVYPRDDKNMHSNNLKVDVTFKNVGVNTTELRGLFSTIKNFFSKTLIVGVYRTPLAVASGGSLDLDIGSAFINTWIDWADNGDIKKMKKMLQLKEELRALFNFKKFDLRVDKEKSNFIVSKDDGDFLLKELGSGLGQFILILSKALMIEPSYIFIDEPETSLHPKMQEIFIRALAAKSEKGVFAVSHSVALARSVSDYIYTITKDNNSKPDIFPYGQHYTPTIVQSINEMGYSQYVEIGGNNILLVEGRTDIKVFREILRKYGIDNSFIIMALGGGEFILNDKKKICDELNEIKRINPRSISVIFDSEKTSEDDVLSDKHQTFKEVCESLGFKVFTTDGHSTENYLSQKAISKVLGSQYTALGRFDKFNSLINKWPKEKNWLVVNAMSKDDFRGTNLDLFITNELVPVVSETYQ